MSSSTSVQSPVPQRRTLSHEEMDKIGHFDEAQSNGTEKETKEASRKMTLGRAASHSSASKESSATAINNDNDNDNEEDDQDEDQDETIPLTQKQEALAAAEEEHENGVGDEQSPKDRKPGLKKIEPLEIAPSEDEPSTDDLEALLGSEESLNETKQKKKEKKTEKKSCCSSCCCCCCCGPSVALGNSRVVCPRLFERTGFGVIGVHWFGPLCVGMIIAFASEFFIRRALVRIGPISAGICVFFTFTTTYLLIDTAFRDPGFVRPGIEPTGDLSKWRWCDMCNTYQPPDGAHCPDCNICVAGYDHHCVWMGTCIGKKNHKQFLRFNLSWLFYFLYATIWVAIAGPLIFHRKHHD